MSKNLINFSDLTKKEIFDLIELAHNFKSEGSQDYRNEDLFPDKKIVSLFCEPSTRTKLSFEIAAHNLGAKFIDFDLDVNKECKTEGCTTVDYWDYYLVRPNPQHRPHVTDYCRYCVKEVGSRFDKGQSYINTYRWDCAYNKDNQKSPEEFYKKYILEEKNEQPKKTGIFHRRLSTRS